MTSTQPRYVLGQRIVIYGQTGSGKTTLSRRLGVALGLGVIELDAINWQPGWQMTPTPEFRAKIEQALAAHPDGWVVEGSYSAVRDIALSRADTVIWLRMPWRVSFSRVLRRTLRRVWTREELWNTNRESLRLTFLSRDSILLWSITHHRAAIRSVQRGLREIPHAARVYELRSARDVEALLLEVGQRARG